MDKLLLEIDPKQIFPEQSLENKIGYRGNITGSAITETGVGIGVRYADNYGSCSMNKEQFIQFLSFCFTSEKLSKYFPQNNFRIMTDTHQVELYRELENINLLVIYDNKQKRVSGLIPF